HQSRTHKKLLDGQLSSRANLNPTFLYEGKSTGESYNHNEVHKGLFKGYLLKWMSFYDA
ncbi:hypothetical protein F5I97DRAFT_1785356, partial [Phlebopus sp. FC_14]